MLQSFSFVVGQADAGRRLDEFLASRFAALSRMRIANLINDGACLLNGLQAKPGHKIAAGDSIEIAFEEGPPSAMHPERLPLEVVYEDDQIIVVVKPAGLLVHPTKSVKSGTLANALAYHLNKEAAIKMPAHGQPHTLVRPGLIHRLDRATSGLMVVAKTQRALSQLTIHFRRRLVEKRYFALVHGLLMEGEGVIVAPIGRDPERQPQWRVIETGKEAETRFRVVERFRQATLVEMEPVTGRTNQLRIHSAFLGHPIVGDNLYRELCSAPPRLCDYIEVGCQNDAEAQRRGGAEHDPQSAIRLCLHAWRLGFHHPTSNEWMEFTSPLPQDFLALLAGLR